MTAARLMRAAEPLIAALPPQEVRAVRIDLVLPTDDQGPLPSPELGHHREPDGEPRLQSWRTPALAVAAAAALELLVREWEEPKLGAGSGLGASVRFMEAAARLSLELVVGGRVRPALVAEGQAFTARWLPVPDADQSRRITLLARAMPATCRAEATWAERPAGALLRSVLDGLVDVAAFVALEAHGVGAGPHRTAGVPRAAGAWLKALGAPEAEVHGSRAQLLRLAGELDDWFRAGMPPAGPLRTCFRLGAPALEDGEWRVEFLLQATDDPSLLVPAETVWRSAGKLVAFDRAVDNPQDHLLADLGRASRLSPLLEPALEESTPTHVALDAEGAHRFLSESAPLLGQAGFGVLVPLWWEVAQTRLAARLRATPKSERANSLGLLGLEGLCAYRWEVALGDQTLSLEDLKRLAALKQPLVQVRGQWVEIRPEEVQRALAVLARDEGGHGHGEITAGEVLRLGLGLQEAEIGLPVVAVEGEGWLGDLLGSAPEARLEPAATPEGFGGTLRPYQERGLAWLRFLGRLGLGACLADDMGLGKTVQLLALLVAERRDDLRPPPTLLVCPMSVVGNWQREAERFAPHLRVQVHHGAERLGSDDFAAVAREHDLVITTYALVTKDADLLSQVEWARVALDEAQNLKNAESKQAQAARRLRADLRVALTGTPVENRLSDLWSIMDFLNPGLLGSAADFRRRMAVPIERYGDEEAANRLKQFTRPFILRRLKTDRSIIHDLPDKVEIKVLCNITKEQATLYQAVLDDMLRQIEASGPGIARKGLILATMMKLKQVCNHPAQMLRDRSRLDGRSGKLARTEEIVEEVLAEGDRALIFTQFAEMGEMLRGYLEERFRREILFLHGGTPKKTRDEMVASFQTQSGPSIFVLSLKAGGTGLNLTAANHVIHFDRWWNPAVEDQATDRAFRIGQRRDVQVRKLVCVGTLEERIDRMIEKKKGLAERIVGSGEAWLTELSTAELRDLVTLSADAVAEA